MPFSVTSWFIEQTQLRTAQPKRVFTLATSDYSDRVLKWPTINKKWNEIRPATLTINLANGDGQFNNLRTNKTLMRSTCEFKVGYTHPSSGDELITEFSGTIEQVRYAEGKVELKLSDGMKEFTERVLGSDDDPLEYVGSNYYPSDIMWWLVTSYGGKDSVKSTSNVDIDYDSWLTVHSVFLNDSVFIQARFKGAKLNEALRKIARMVDAGVFVEGGKITFARFLEVGSYESLITDDEARSIDLIIDDTLVVNRQWVYADYNATSDAWGINVLNQSSVSVNSFGLREEVEKDEAVWYTSSATALNLAERRTSMLAAPPERYEIDTTLVAMPRQIGETVRIVDDSIGVSSSSAWRVMGYRKDYDTGRIKLEVSNERQLNPFILDDDVYGLLDQDYNFLL